MSLRTRDFEWTPELETAALWSSVAPAIAAIVSNFVVLGFAIAIFRHPKTRPLLRRQSLLMLLTVQISGLVTGASYLMQNYISGPSGWCTAAVHFTLLSTQYTNFIVTLIGVNLCLSVAYGIHTHGWTIYYTGGSLAAAIIIWIPGAVRGVWGYDVIGQECWVAIQGAEERFAWQVGSAYAWTILCCLVSIGSTGLVLYALAASRSRARKLFDDSDTSHVSQDKLVQRVAFRIIWYPILLVLFAIPEITADFINDKDGSISTMTAYVIWCIAGTVYAIMPLMLALLTMFVDPSFSKAVRILLFPHWDTPLDIPVTSSEAHGAGSTLVFSMGPNHTQAIGLSPLKSHVQTEGDGASAHTHDVEGKAGHDDVPFDGHHEEAVADGPGLPLSPPLQQRLRARARSTASYVDLRAL